MEDFKNSKKYTAIMSASKDLFWKLGVRRVSIEEICREAKTSKMTFYRYFPDKIDLAKKVIDQFYDESMTNFRKIIREKSPVSEKMQKMIKMKMEGSTDISTEFIQDLLNSSDPELSSYFKEKLKFIYAEGIKEFKIGQNDGWIRKDLNVEFMFLYFQKTTSFLADKKILEQFKSPQELIMELTNLVIYGIVPRN